MQKLDARIAKQIWPASSPAAALPALGPLQRLASPARFREGETIYFQEQRADHWYRVVSGAVRECALTADGRRQVVGFLLRGDIFGLSGRGSRAMACEIIVDSQLERFPRREAEAMAESDPLVARSLREMAFDAIDRMQTRTLLLGCTSAVEKVAAFLLEMAARSDIPSGAPIALPMNRNDIADYLGLAVETVSRTITALCRQGTIALAGSRCVQVLDQQLLTHLGSANAMCAPAVNRS